jgi:hypothetical protein
MSVAGIVAVNCVALTNEVARSLLFKRTTELAAKLDPLTVRVNCWPPTRAKPGLRLVITGASGAGWTVKLRAFDVPPPGAGLNAVTLAVPAVAMSVAGIAAESR